MSTTVDSRPLSAVARFHWIMTAIVSSLLAVDWVLAERVQLHGFWPLIAKVLYAAVLLAMVWAYGCWCGHERFTRTAEMVLWSGVLFSALSVLTQVAGRSPAPLVDAQLARIDGMLHWDTSRVVTFVRGVPTLAVGFRVAYDLLLALMLAALLVPSLAGQWRASARYILAVTLASVTTSLLFAFLPAVGPWTIYGYAPSPDQAAVAGYLHGLKGPGSLAMGLDRCGVVSFPSFHVVLAIMSTYALWSFHKLRWISVTLTIAITISTVTTGWHYGVDVIGGVILALIAQRVARTLV